MLHLYKRQSQQCIINNYRYCGSTRHKSHDKSRWRKFWSFSTINWWPECTVMGFLWGMYRKFQVYNISWSQRRNHIVLPYIGRNHIVLPCVGRNHIVLPCVGRNHIVLPCIGRNHIVLPCVGVYTGLLGYSEYFVGLGKICTVHSSTWVVWNSWPANIYHNSNIKLTYQVKYQDKVWTKKYW